MKGSFLVTRHLSNNKKQKKAVKQYSTEKPQKDILNKNVERIYKSIRQITILHGLAQKHRFCITPCCVDTIQFLPNLDMPGFKLHTIYQKVVKV